MKLFEKNIPEVLEYLKLPVVDNKNELELIFGSTPFKNPIDKNVFLRVLDYCHNTYKKHSEIIDLDNLGFNQFGIISFEIYRLFFML